MMNREIWTFSLKTEATIDPIGIDARLPRFSWKLGAERTNCYQSAYHIIVGTEDGTIVWNTGKICSDRQLEVIYGGLPLKSATRYGWRVKVWDEKDNASDWSEEAFFETGLLETSDWKGSWIGGNSLYHPLEGLSWIGCSVKAGDIVEFGCTFFVDKPLQQAVFDGTAWESWELYCNGKLWRKMNTDWKQRADSPIRYADLTEFFSEGENTLCIRVTADEKGKAATIGKLLLRDICGRETCLSSDVHWKVYKDGVWSAADIVGRYGETSYRAPKRRGPAPLLRREFLIEQKIIRARLYICGLGYEVCTINGQLATEALLHTEYSQYHKSVYYYTLDVTDYLHAGWNCMGVELGRGHYSFHKDWIGHMEEQDEPKLLLQLMIWGSDGSCQIVVSDTDWKTTDSPTVDDNIWYGEKYDARLFQDNWNKIGFDDSKWKKILLMKAPGGKLRAAMLPMIRITEELNPINVFAPSKKVRVYDFGKVTAGGARISVQEMTGTRLKLTYGETLMKNGRVDMETPKRVFQFWEPGQTDIYVCRGGEKECWSPKFSYKGYRYIEVEGVDHEISIVGLTFHNDLQKTGDFRCSHELFNQIHSLIIPTILNNFHSIPTDTPAYEKRGWTGDAQSICDTALRNLDAQMFFEKWIQDLCDSQNEDGAIPDTCPGPVFYPPAPEWMCAMIMLPYQLYLHCGNETVLKKCYPQMKQYTAYEMGRLQNGMSSNRFYGDWNSPAGACPPEGSVFNATCFVYRIVTLMAEISQALKMYSDEKEYRTFAEQMRKDLNERFFDEQEMIYHTEIQAGFRQTPTVLPLAFGIASEEKQLEIAKSLAEHIHRIDQDHLSTGCMGLKYLAPVLTKYGQAETAYAIVNQTDFPGWGYWISCGATTCWEEWSVGTRSYNHFYFGTIDDWFYQYLAGIQPLEAGYRSFQVSPYPCGAVEEVEASMETVYGRISVHWVIVGGRFHLEVSVPVNTTAKIIMPQGESYSVGSGRHQYSSE